MKRMIFTLLLMLLASWSFAADLSITAANVKLLSLTPQYRTVQFGETVTAGQAVYKKAADGKYWKADNDVDLATATVAGIAYTGGAADGYGVIVVSGPMDLGATLTAGTYYVLSSTAGGICPAADLGSSDFIVTLGVATTTGRIIVDIKNTGEQKP
jgi:hypothetical protein